MTRYNNLLIISIILIILMPGTTYGQIRQNLSFQAKDIRKDTGLLSVDMDINLHNLDISTNEYIVITPALRQNSGQVMEMPEIIINGNTTQKKYNRYIGLGGEPADAYLIMQLPEQNNTVIPYRASIPYHTWMDNAELIVIAESCGCGNSVQEKEIFIINNLQSPVYTTSYIIPEKEPIKNRVESGEAYVIFPVNQTTLLPTLANNASELAKIRQSIDYIKEVDNIQIKNVAIEAYASPEGALDNNIRLSEGRAAALRDYVISHYNIDRNLFTVRSKGENWEGLKEAVINSVFTESQKQDILSIIDMTDLDTRKAKLKSYQNGEPYRIMLNSIYPELRRSEYKIDYIVPSFTIEEGKRLLHSKPGMLSLNEMYIIANTYDRDTDEFKEVFDIAVRLYPQDMTANLNAAAIALDKGDTGTAKKYLQPYMNNPQAYNNLGVLYALEGNRELAENYFRQAVEAGDKEAAGNLNQLNK